RAIASDSAESAQCNFERLAAVPIGFSLYLHRRLSGDQQVSDFRLAQTADADVAQRGIARAAGRAEQARSRDRRSEPSFVAGHGDLRRYDSGFVVARIVAWQDG